jgi:hypothetical protein
MAIREQPVQLEGIFVNHFRFMFDPLTPSSKISDAPPIVVVPIT